MRIIVDGYNFIGRDKGLRGDLEKKRRELIERLSAYRQAKGFPVTVVFDGGDWGEAREMWGGVEVIFSGKGTSADEVIGRMAEELREGCTVATSDREVQRRVQSCGGIAIYSGEFEKRLAAARPPGPSPASSTDAPDPSLSEKDRDEPEGPARGPDKKGNPRKLSKAERLRQGRLKRL